MPSSRAAAAALRRLVAVQFLPGQGHSHWRFCPSSTCFRLMFVNPVAEESCKLPGQERENVPNTKSAKSRTDGATTGSTCATPASWCLRSCSRRLPWRAPDGSWIHRFICQTVRYAFKSFHLKWTLNCKERSCAQNTPNKNKRNV